MNGRNLKSSNPKTQIVTSLKKQPMPCALALGMFDGVHLGHRRVISETLSQKGLLSAALTFKTNEQKPLKKQNQPYIMTFENRVNMLCSMGLDMLFALNFDEIKQLSAEEFVKDILSLTLNAKIVCCGEDFRFGKNASGDINTLKELCKPLGIEVRVVPKLMDSNLPISSTRIRKYLKDGDIKAANRLLGYCYYIKGEVIYGNRLGRTINCPTVNQKISPNICQLKFGVYASYAIINGKKYPAITNIGVKPTVNEGNKPLAETHIIGIDKDLYGDIIRIELFDFIREEKRFGSFEELAGQILSDINTVKSLTDKK